MLWKVEPQENIYPRVPRSPLAQQLSSGRVSTHQSSWPSLGAAFTCVSKMLVLMPCYLSAIALLIQSHGGQGLRRKCCAKGFFRGEYRSALDVELSVGALLTNRVSVQC